MARQATGPNEHPSTPTFLQVYKMLSIYSLLKPPKTGNCKILEPSVHTISINDLHYVVNNDDVTQRNQKIENLKKKLDSLITIDMGLDEIFDNSIHNYNKSEVEDCVLYYICGFMTKNLIKNIKCNICLTTISGMYPFIKTCFKISK